MVCVVAEVDHEQVFAPEAVSVTVFPKQVTFVDEAMLKAGTAVLTVMAKDAFEIHPIELVAATE